MSDYRLFLPHIHPLVFVARPGPRPHAGLNYQLVLLIHTGHRLVSCKQAILRGLERLRRLRAAHADLLGGADCAARLFVIVWRDEFHPRHGKQTTALRNAVAKLATTVAAERLTIEMHNVLELQYDATRNWLVPKHTAVDRATEPGIATIADAEFRTIFVDDVQVKLHGFVPGQVIRIDRTDFELGGDELTYNMVRLRATH